MQRMSIPADAPANYPQTLRAEASTLSTAALREAGESWVKERSRVAIESSARLADVQTRKWPSAHKKDSAPRGYRDAGCWRQTIAELIPAGRAPESGRPRE